MRRDVCYYFAADVATVFNAYVAAAENPPFKRECTKEPYHTFSFGLNFSMKYNMNGGACVLHFIPHQGGTAVDLRFVVAQLWGARYERYAKDLTDRAAAILRLPPQETKLPIELFTNDANKVTTATPASNLGGAHSFCKQCGRGLKAEDKFCPGCGTGVEPTVQKSFCPNCGNQITAGSAFCAKCGSKLNQ